MTRRPVTLAWLQAHTAENPDGPLPTPCWDTTGAVQADGYPTDGLVRRVYLDLVGDLPDTWEPHHRCNRARCLNPEHLIGMSASANMVEAWSRNNSKGLSRRTSRMAGWLHGRVGDTSGRMV